MDAGAIASIVSAVVAVLTAIGAFVAYLRASAAAAQAQAAQKESALAEQRSTKASEDAAAALRRANEIAQEAAARAGEDWFVEWRAKWSRETCELTLTNRGRDAAHAPSVVVTGAGLHHVSRSDQAIQAGEPLVVALPEIADRRAAHRQSNQDAVRRSAGRGITYVPVGFRAKLRVVLHWRTGLGLPGEQEIEIAIS